MNAHSMVACFTLALPLSVAAQADTVNVELPARVQFSVPASPALKFIGANPEEIGRPTSFKALAASILSGVDADGRFQQGAALEIAPVQFLWTTMDASEFAEAANFILSNIGLSAGTVKTASDSSSTALGLGARVVLFDRTDPMSSAAHVEAVGKALESCFPMVDGRPVPIDPDDQEQLSEVRACVVREDSAARGHYAARHWNDYALSAGVATGWLLENSEWDRKEPMGMQAWATLAAPICFVASVSNPFCRAGQLLMEVQYEVRDSTFDQPESISQWALGGRVTFGNERVGVFAEALLLRRADAPAGIEEKVRELSTGLEFQVAEKLWASTGLGTRYNDLEGESQVVVLANLRVNVSPERKLKSVVPLPPAVP